MNTTACVELVTPEMAQGWLATSRGNRSTDGSVKIYKKQVDYLVGVIRRGEWLLTNSGPAFDVNGVLVDAHHRLTAVVQSGIAVKMLVTRNLPVRSVHGIDHGGRSRSISDVTGVNRRLAQTLRLALVVAHTSKTHTVSPEELLRIANSPLSAAHTRLTDTCNTATRSYSKCGIRLAYCTQMLMADNDEDISYVLDQYRYLNLGHFDEMSHSTQTLFRCYTGVSKGGMARNEDQLESLARAFICSDPNRRDFRRLHCTGSLRLKIIRDVGRFYADMFGVAWNQESE